MSDEILPSQGPEREIFLVALKRMSEQCCAPNLLEECPFSVDVPQGGRGCLEECLKLLEDHGRVSTGQEVDISGGAGLSAYKRPSSYVDAVDPTEERAFDAKEIFYRESARDLPARWNTVALVFAVREALTKGPGRLMNEVQFDLQACFDELARRGIDALQLARRGLSELIAKEIGNQIAVNILFEEWDDKPKDLLWYEHSIEEWKVLCDRSFTQAGRPTPESISEPTPESISELPEAGRILYALIQFPQRVEVWCGQAGSEDLKNWTAPKWDDLPQSEGDQSLKLDDARISRWFWDRLSSTFLEDWAEESLNIEWQYIRRKEPAPISESEMALRMVSPAELAARVADHHVNQTKSSPVGVRAKSAAITLIREGRTRAAAQLFQAALSLSWADPELYNNYGFCLLPESPLGALSALEKAHQMGYSDPVNSANRLLALHWAGKVPRALELAVELMAMLDEIKESKSFLWSFTAGQANAELFENACRRCYTANLAVHVAEKSGEEGLADRWREAARALGVSASVHHIS
jgi:hypothetical protein